MWIAGKGLLKKLGQYWVVCHCRHKILNPCSWSSLSSMLCTRFLFPLPTLEVVEASEFLLDEVILGNVIVFERRCEREEKRR